MSQFSGKYPRFVKWMVGLALVLLLLPEVIRFAAVKAVSSSGVGEASIGDVDFNLFTGELGVEQFNLTRDGKNTLSVGELAVDLGWLRLLSGEIAIESLVVDDVKLAVLETEQGDWDVVIPLSSEKQSDEAESQVDTEKPPAGLPKVGLKQLLVRGAQITVNSAAAQGVLTIDKLKLQRASTWRETSPTLTLLSHWNEATIELNVSAEPLASEPNLQGELTVNQFPLASVAGAAGQALVGAVSLDLTFDGQRNLDAAIRSAVKGTISLDEFQVQYGPLDVSHRQLSLQAKASASLIDGEVTYQLGSDIESQGLSVVDTKQNISLVNWDEFSLSNLSVDERLNASFDQLSINAIDAVNDVLKDKESEEQGRLHTGAVTINNLTLTEAKKLSIEEVKVESSQYQVVVQQDGQLQLASVLGAVVSNLKSHSNDELNKTGKIVDDNEAPKANPEKSSGADVEPMTITVNSFSVGGDSYIEWQDLRFSVPVKEKIIIEELTVKGIDQTQVDQPATINLLSRVGEFSRANISGEIKPFAQKTNASISGKLEAIALPTLSPYSEAVLGYHLTTGQYDHEFDIDIVNDEIKLKNKLKLRKLTLSVVDPDKPQPMAKQLDVPLEFALDMLRDGDDNISLDVPIEGKLDDPNVNIGTVVSDALGYAVKNGATSYLKYAIQPYGAVLIAAEFVGDQVSAISLDPVLYSSGQSELTQEHSAYISKVATLMLERPKLTIKLCGQANEKDKLAIAETLIKPEGGGLGAEKNLAVENAKASVTEEQLVELAKTRAHDVKRLFIDSGVESKRVFSCQPQYKAEATNGVIMAI